ncbi:nicotinate phosphoribosyltransferase [Culicoidibacter larvae]|uniref:Nicotinamide phosphoribosyltransferase n=1 Tax=Culicoidibacter larvae TaxID=2579976 RepID=A0A5R8QH78_9FIRM|nr:nicotinate phosphoribosyltransferase [Culicoidibacter larvae]TLG77399.1 nicotinate phosphoribosyltransferase [Culicoidibacter larvae]
MKEKNLILQTDSYKLSHFQQFPDGMTYMFDYIESRGGAYGYTRFFGLQYLLKEYLERRVTMAMVDEAAAIAAWHGVPFNYDGWKYIVEVLDGKLPLLIRAVPEGAIVRNHNALVTVESTDANVPWIVGWAETLLMKVWYPVTVTTFSYKVHRMIGAFLELTSDNAESELPFKLHDFGYRGASSEESAGIGGMSHLVNFMGTDTLAALLYARDYYGAEQAGFSVPASEHSTMTSWGRERESDAFRNMIEKHDEFPLISIVSDSYNFYEAVENKFGVELHDVIMAHDGFVVIRPDSGDALTNILFTLESAEKHFGVTLNSKGYKVLNKIRILQGDGVSENVIYDILLTMKKEGYSAENIAFGVGGALLQGNYQSSINRDTHKFAMKCSAIGLGAGDAFKLQDVYKSPITDRGKVSKRGRLDTIVNGDGRVETVNIDQLPLGEYHPDTILQTVYRDGGIVKLYGWDEVKENEDLVPHAFPSGLEGK